MLDHYISEEDDEFGFWADIDFDGVVQRVRYIEPGSFWMGGLRSEGILDHEGPQHNVKLSKGFWMFDTPVTQKLWTLVMGSNPSYFSGSLSPVESVNWNDICGFFIKVDALFPGINLTLPTEAQWEYACRAGTRIPYYAGVDKDLSDIAWFTENSDGKTHPVAGKLCNAWGLYDMLGNVWEMCNDDLRQYESWSEADPIGSPLRKSSAIRGGSYSNTFEDIRSFTRNSWLHTDTHKNVGFRCIILDDQG